MTDQTPPALQKTARRALWGVGAIVMLGLLALCAPRSEQSRSPSPEQVAAMEAARIQTEAEAQYTCGADALTVCICKGDGVVMRYLKPGQVAWVRANGSLEFVPPISPTTIILCDKDPYIGGTCVDHFGQNLNVNRYVLVKNVSDRTQNVGCRETASSL